MTILAYSNLCCDYFFKLVTLPCVVYWEDDDLTF